MYTKGIFNLALLSIALLAAGCATKRQTDTIYACKAIVTKSAAMVSVEKLYECSQVDPIDLPSGLLY